MSEAVPTAAAFAPSELVVLFGDRFAPEAGMLASKEEVLTSGVKVNSEKLMNAAVRAALYALRRAGAVRLEPRAGKALFGLMKTQKLLLLPGASAGASFPGALEEFLVQAALEEKPLNDVLAAFIGEEVTNPPQRVLGMIKRGMSERGLLEAEMRTTMIVFTTVDYVLPASTLAMAEVEPLQPVLDLLRDAEQREAELDALVQKNIDSARVRMTESRND